MFKGSIPALVTPMQADGAVDFQAWDRLLDFHVAEGTDGIVVGGTTGESPTLEPAEVAELVRRAKARVAGRMPVIAGSGTNSTAKSIELSRELAAAGPMGCWPSCRITTGRPRKACAGIFPRSPTPWTAR